MVLFSSVNVWSQSKISKDLIDRKLEEIANTGFKISTKEKELLKLKAESEQIGYDEGFFRSVSFLMTGYENQNKNKEIIELRNKIKRKLDKYKEDQEGLISSIYRRSSVAFGYLGLDDAARKDLRLALKYANTIHDEDKKNYRKGLIYENFTQYFSNQPDNKKNERDSILYYLKQSLQASQNIKNKDGFYNNLKPDNIAFNNVKLGIFYLEQATVKGSLEKAEKYLLESYEIYNNKKYSLSPYDKNVMLNQMSWLYMEKKDYKKSIDFANQALLMEEQYRNPSNRMESYEFLATGYMELGQKEKAKLYMSKYTYLKDSINMSLRNDADASMKKIIEEADTEYKQSSKKQWMITGILALIAGLITAILWRKKNKALRKKYEQMMVNLKSEKKDQVEETNEETDLDNTGEESNDDLQAITNKNTISADTEIRILKKLAAFEKSEKYLKKDLTISSLAAQLNTNTKYLSEVIKNNTSQNFNHYINNLRINYIVHKLYNEPKYREYKISYLAEECGFASSQVFVIAFKKINGLTPSYFIQSLKEDKVNILVSEDSLL